MERSKRRKKIPYEVLSTPAPSEEGREEKFIEAEVLRSLGKLLPDLRKPGDSFKGASFFSSDWFYSIHFQFH
jgi:hypothetical protein